MEKDRKSIKGIRIKALNAAIIIVSCIVYIFLIYTTAVMTADYHKMVDSTYEYIECEKSATMMYQASDYLTEQVRLFTQNMDINNMKLYFEEINKSKRREKALEELEIHKPDEAVIKDLSSALQSSNDLMKRELYAMKLISEAKGYDDSMLPQEVRDAKLNAADAGLGTQEKIDKARDLVFNSDYQAAKAQIYSHLSSFFDDITGSTKAQQAGSTEALSKAILKQRIFISILFVLNILTFIAITVLIVKPLSVHIKHIRENETLEIIGAYEFKYLALTYNDIYALNSANERMLMQKAEHDPLTGLLNRGVFDSLREFFKDGDMSIALIVVDVDNFKRINDEYGHEIGDKVLKMVADTIRQSFRPNDYVIRLGGDEFAIILTDIAEEDVSIIKRKFQRINNTLTNPKDDMLPPVTLSAGAAFSEKAFSDELFGKADKALYDAKNGGRGRCCFDSEYAEV